MKALKFRLTPIVNLKGMEIHNRGFIILRVPC